MQNGGVMIEAISSLENLDDVCAAFLLMARIRPSSEIQGCRGRTGANVAPV